MIVVHIERRLVVYNVHTNTGSQRETCSWYWVIAEEELMPSVLV